MLELRDRADDLEEQPADGGGRVNALIEHDEVNAPLLEFAGELDQVLERAAEAVELGDDELIASAIGR